MPKHLLSKGPIRLAPGDLVDLRLATLKTEDAISEHDRGRLCFALEEYEKAMNFFSNSYESNKASFGDTDERTLKSLNDLAAAQMELQQYDEAYENFLQAFNGLKSKMGLGDDSTICAQCNLALSCYYTKKTKQGNQTVNDIMETRQTLRKQKRDISERATNHYSSLLADNETFKQWRPENVTYEAVKPPPVPKINTEAVQMAISEDTIRRILAASSAMKGKSEGKGLGLNMIPVRSGSHSPSSRSAYNAGKLSPTSAAQVVDGTRLEAVKDTHHQRSRSLKASFKLRYGEESGTFRQKYRKNPNYISQPLAVVHSNSISADDLFAVSPTSEPPPDTSPINEIPAVIVLDHDHSQGESDLENDQTNVNDNDSDAVIVLESVENNIIRFSGTNTLEFRDSLPHNLETHMTVQLQGAGEKYSKDKIIEANALLDSGADRCMINVDLVEALGLEIKSSDENLEARVADDRVMTGIRGTAQVSVVLRFKSGRQRTVKVNFVVLDTSNDDVILSNSFIGQYGLYLNNVDISASTIAFRKKTKQEILEERVLEEERKRRRAEETKALEEERVRDNEIQRRDQSQASSFSGSPRPETPDHRSVL